MLSQYWETVRWLRPVQIYGRIGFKLLRPPVDARPAPPLRRTTGVWAEPARPSPSLFEPRSFKLLNQTGSLSEIGWNGPQRSALWRYNQHYFDDLNAQDAASRRGWHQQLIADWIADNPPAAGVGWDPYPASLRIVNWIKWSLGGGSLDERAVQSVAVQARWLSRRLEWHLLGNHLFANAKALVFSGLFFAGHEANTWLLKGLRILTREMPEQVLPDGGQFELSPMYHAIALEDVLDLINITRRYAAALPTEGQELATTWRSLVDPMRRWLNTLSHPDGGIAFFNDAAFGAARCNADLDAYALRLGFSAIESVEGLTHLRESGYARLENSDAAAIIDLAKIGPDYLPGHAHADTLSFELSLFGRRVFVNSGTSTYEPGPERSRQRSTAAHNTLSIPGQNSSDVWSSFRVGRRARPFHVATHCDGVSLSAEGAHDGYVHLPGRPVHFRRLLLQPKRLRVEDHLNATAPAEVRFHVHPEMTLSEVESDRGRLVFPDGKTAAWRCQSGPIRVEPTSWHPEFGKTVPNQCIVAPLKDNRAVFELDWS